MAYKIDIKLTKDDDLPWWWTSAGIAKYGSEMRERTFAHFYRALGNLGISDEDISSTLAAIFTDDANPREIMFNFVLESRKNLNKFLVDSYNEPGGKLKPDDYLNYHEEFSIVEV